MVGLELLELLLREAGVGHPPRLELALLHVLQEPMPLWRQVGLVGEAFLETDGDGWGHGCLLSCTRGVDGERDERDGEARCLGIAGPGQGPATGTAGSAQAV